MSRERLIVIVQDLETRGIDSRALRTVQMELEVIEAPPGVFGKISHKAKEMAKAQWANVVGEIRESKEMFGLLKRSLAREELSDAEQAHMKAQMYDLLRAVPAGLIAATNSALPVPGTSVLTPWILVKAGLMPSRWREAHVLSELQKQATELRDSGHFREAAAVTELHDEIERDADRRAFAEREAALLTHWDANQNGVWDEDEREAYNQSALDLRAMVASHGNQERWFLQAHGQVFGPLKIAQLGDGELDPALLACFDGKSGWVALSDLR